jgi:hypothetical protein
MLKLICPFRLFPFPAAPMLAFRAFPPHFNFPFPRSSHIFTDADVGHEQKGDTMKRDMNLIRLLLLETEGEEPKPDLSVFSEDQRLYHSALLIEADLVHGQIIEDGSGQPASTVTLRLTWAGHEFLDAARNDTIWHKAGERIKKSGVDVSLSVLKEVLNQLLKQSLGLP